MASRLLTERRGSALILTFSDPPTRNTLSHELLASGIEALQFASEVPGIRCVLLQGDGGHFCAGGNLQGLVERRRVGPPAQLKMLEHLHQFVQAMGTCPKPVIAAVEGAAAGAGFSLALACDLIVAAEDARFILSYSRIGLSPDGGATAALMQSLPRQRVQQLLWLAEPVSARDLHVWGLAGWVVEPGQALAVALGLGDRLAALAPNATASSKNLLRLAPGRTLREQLDAERDHFVDNLFHDNGAEGLTAFFEKRPAKFQ